jgi:large subunit ribosomal protein L6
MSDSAARIANVGGEVVCTVFSGESRMSRIGKKPVSLPTGVAAVVSGQTIEVKGPKGSRSFTASDDVTLLVEESTVSVMPRGKSKRARQQWGMCRTMVANLVTGVTAGFKKELEIKGVGYRAQLQGNVLKLNLGLSHDVDFQVPDGVTVTVPKQTEIVVEGEDQQLVGQVAANIREWRRPEPYKGKGIMYKDEYIFRKEGKKK